MSQTLSNLPLSAVNSVHDTLLDLTLCCVRLTRC